jgi:ribose transport system ATP-binding protein
VEFSAGNCGELHVLTLRAAVGATHHMEPQILEARNITKVFPGAKALDDVSFKLHKNEIHAIVGENGAGKSTLIKILTGIYRQESGTVLLDDKVATYDELYKSISYVPQELSLFGSLTVAENIFLPFDATRVIKRIVKKNVLEVNARAILNTLEAQIDVRKIAKNITTAEQQIVQIARSMAHEFRVMILDEPTSSISANEALKLIQILKRLRDSGKSIIYISHKMEEVFSLADTITILRDGMNMGTYRIDEITQNEVIEKMAGRELSSLVLGKKLRRDLKDAKVSLKVEDLVGIGFSAVNFELRAGEILGFAGLVGAGRTEIAKTIIGELPRFHGRVTIGGREVRPNNLPDATSKGIVYLPEDRKYQGIFSILSVRENISVSSINQITVSGVVSKKKESKLVSGVVSKFNVKTPSLETSINLLSGGNQQKTIIGRIINIGPKVIILDEPTKGIDVNSKAEIYRIIRSLAEQGVAIILISSELEEVISNADRILVFYSGAQKGSFDAYEIDSQKDLLRQMIGLENIQRVKGDTN